MTALFLQRRFATAATAAALTALLAAPSFAQQPAAGRVPTAGAERPHRMPAPGEREARMAHVQRPSGRSCSSRRPSNRHGTPSPRPCAPAPGHGRNGTADHAGTHRPHAGTARPAQRRSGPPGRRHENLLCRAHPGTAKVFDAEHVGMHGPRHKGMHGDNGPARRHGTAPAPCGSGTTVMRVRRACGGHLQRASQPLSYSGLRRLCNLTVAT